MISKKVITGMFFLAGFVSSSVFAATQSIVTVPSSFSDVTSGSAVKFTIKYPSTNPAASTGLGLKVYYDSSKLTPNAAVAPFPAGITGLSTNQLVGVQDLPDTNNGDGDASTDRFFNIAWAATGQFDPPWAPLGEDLVTIGFTASAGMTSNTSINFTGEPATGNTFVATNIPVTIPSIVVPDTTPPVVVAPADITVEASGPTTTVALGTATATDNVDGVLVPTPSPVGPYAVGVHTVTWSATDAAGNKGTATQKVTVTDTTPPVISVSDITKQSTGTTTAVSLGATATDLVDGAITPTTTDSKGPFSVGVHTIKWTAVDAAGNSSTKTQKVTITEKPVDRQPPVISIPVRDLTFIIPRGADKIRLADLNFHVRATDNVGVVKLEIISIENADLPEFLPPGDYIITWRATDAAGNVATRTQHFTVRLAADATEIPTLSEWGVIFLSLMLALLSGMGIGRKKKI